MLLNHLRWYFEYNRWWDRHFYLSSSIIYKYVVKYKQNPSENRGSEEITIFIIPASYVVFVTWVNLMFIAKHDHERGFCTKVTDHLNVKTTFCQFLSTLCISFLNKEPIECLNEWEWLNSIDWQVDNITKKKKKCDRRSCFFFYFLCQLVTTKLKFKSAFIAHLFYKY